MTLHRVFISIHRHLCVCVPQKTKDVSAVGMWNKKRNKFRCLQKQPQPCFVWLTFIPCAKSEGRFLTVNLFIRTKIGSVIGTQLHTEQTKLKTKSTYLSKQKEKCFYLCWRQSRYSWNMYLSKLWCFVYLKAALEQLMRSCEKVLCCRLSYPDC